MPRIPLAGAATLDDIDDFFTLKPIITPQSNRQITGSEASASAQPKTHKKEALRGRIMDDHGDPVTVDTFALRPDLAQPSYKL